MKRPSIKDDLIDELNKLPLELQLKVLDFTKALLPKGVTGKSVCKFEGMIPPEDLSVMSQAIEEGCEKVDPGEW